jgi:hypothetical protein
MLTASDLGPGWAPANVDLSALPCSVPRSAAIVGAGGYAVRQAQAGGSPSVVEFAGEVSSPGQSYISAIDYLQTSESCRRTTGDHTQTSTFEGVLPLPRQGDRSVAMVFSNAVDGASSQTGYEVVRTGHIVAVVGYTDAGTLDAAQLQNVTSTAVGKLTG